MAPRRGRKAATTAIAQPVTGPIDAVPNDTEQIDVKPAKAEIKKGAAKNSKKIEQNEENTNDNVAVVADVKVKSKRAPAKKNAKPTEQTEQNGGNTDDRAVVTAKADTKSKKAPAKKKTKQSEQSADVVVENATVEAAKESPEKGKKRSARAKPKQEEPPKVESTATKGKPKEAEQSPPEEVNSEAGPSKTGKKSAKKGAVKNEAVEEDSKPKNKRGAKKERSPEKPTESKKQPKGRAKKADTAKPTTKASKAKQQQTQPTDDVDNVDENKDDDSAKGRKRKPAKIAASPAKKVKKETAVSSTVAVNSPEPTANGDAKKRKADSTTNKADSTTSEADDELVTKRKKTPKDDVKTVPKAKMNATATDYSKINFDTDKSFTMKIVSWNVSGLRALITKDGFDYFEHEKPDIICLQEIKCLEEEVPEKAKLKGYHPYWCSTAGGRGGVCILSKSMPYNVEKNIGNEEMDEEGRIITAEYSKFYLVCVYVPNAGRGLVNLDRRLRWNEMFEKHVTKLKETKPVVICGDMNVAHEEIDLANPNTNKKSAGFSKEEREGMTDLLGLGFIDTFRDLYPDQEKAYTFWTYMGNSRAKNVGWRLDYFLVSDNLQSKVVDSFMRPQILGSDHCPIVALLNI